MNNETHLFMDSFTIPMPSLNNLDNILEELTVFDYK